MAITSHDPIPTSQLDGAVKDYSRDKVYVLTALFLGFLTVIEVLTYTHPDFPVWSGNMLIVTLMILMAVKFFVVVHIFMHLRFDKPILSWIFWAGVTLAAGVYLIMMCAFRIFWPESHG